MNTPPPARSAELLNRHRSRLLLVDLQERVMAPILEREALIARCRFLAQGAQILSVPIYMTEQYPKGLGATIPEIAEFATVRPAKLRFSCTECLGWTPPGPEDPFQIVVAGIEAHVCILQTTLDLLALGYQVHVPVDAVSDRIEVDRQIAFRRMELSGAVLTTAETVLLEWCETAEASEFKALSKHLKGQA